MSPPPEPLPATLASYLRDHGQRYFAELADKPLQVLPRRSMLRRRAALYRFELRAAGACRYVLVKSSNPVDETATPADRPRIGTPSEAGLRTRLEHAAMTAIEQHFLGLGDPRFGAIRVLDLLPHDRALVMEESPYANLRQLLVRGVLRRGPGPSALGAAFRNAGAWLRAYHRLTTITHAKDRRTRRDDLIESVRDYVSYLAEASANAAVLRGLAGAVASAARKTLPARLPLGMAHGDYAPRNVLVGPAGEVSVIDTLGRWRVPIYQDIAFFLVALDVVGPRIMTHGRLIGRARVERYRAEFLRGYFADEPPPLASILLFEVECLLDRWTSAVHRHRQAAGIDRVRRRIELELKRRFLVARLKVLMSSVNG